MNRIDQLLQEIREFKASEGLTNSGLAARAGLHANTLRDIDEKDWSPTAYTIRRLEGALRGEKQARPRRKRAVAA